MHSKISSAKWGDEVTYFFCQYTLLFYTASFNFPIWVINKWMYTRNRNQVFGVSWWRHQMEKKIPCYWLFMWGIHRWPVNSPHKSQWRGALMFSLICAWMNGWVNNREAGDLRRHRAHHDVTVMVLLCFCFVMFIPSLKFHWHSYPVILHTYIPKTFTICLVCRNFGIISESSRSVRLYSFSDHKPLYIYKPLYYMSITRPDAYKRHSALMCVWNRW